MLLFFIIVRENGSANLSGHLTNGLHRVHVLEFLIHNQEGGEEIADRDGQIHERYHRHMPLHALGVVHEHVVESVEDVELQTITDEEEGKQKA